jgi:hypothetical protein
LLALTGRGPSRKKKIFKVREVRGRERELERNVWLLEYAEREKINYEAHLHYVVVRFSFITLSYPWQLVA